MEHLTLHQEILGFPLVPPHGVPTPSSRGDTKAFVPQPGDLRQRNVLRLKVLGEASTGNWRLWGNHPAASCGLRFGTRGTRSF